MTTNTWISSQVPTKSVVGAEQVENYHIKLWIGTIKSLGQHSEFDNTAVFGERNITNVDIVGTVVNRLSLARADIYDCKNEIEKHISNQ